MMKKGAFYYFSPASYQIFPPLITLYRLLVRKIYQMTKFSSIDLLVKSYLREMSEMERGKAFYNTLIII